MNIEEIEKSIQVSLSLDKDNNLFHEFKNEYEFTMDGNLDKLLEYHTLNLVDDSAKISEYYHKLSVQS